MYAYLKGKFTHKTPAQVYLDVNGIGFEVNISLHTYTAILPLTEGVLFTHLQIKEDEHVLFGFSDKEEKEIFIQLIGVSGIGAATARMMLSSMKPEEIQQAILVGNTKQLEGIKGIGKKTAERIVLELKDKLGKLDSQNVNSGLINNTLEQDALNALQALGIPKPAAEGAIKKALSGNSNYNLEQLIKKALQSI